MLRPKLKQVELEKGLGEGDNIVFVVIVAVIAEMNGHLRLDTCATKIKATDVMRGNKLVNKIWTLFFCV